MRILRFSNNDNINIFAKNIIIFAIFTQSNAVEGLNICIICDILFTVAGEKNEKHQAIYPENLCQTAAL